MSIHPEARPGQKRPGPFLKLAMWWGPRPLLQAAIILFAVVALAALASIVLGNMARIGITPGFDFLGRSANFEIGEQLVSFNAGDTYLRALAVGLLNTIKVAVLGCLLATLLGVAIGVAGLSGNALLGGLVRGYIELIRNTPLLLQLFLWISLAQALPPPRRAFSLFDTVFLSNRGVFVPGPVFEGATAAVWLAILLVLVIVTMALIAGRRRMDWRGIVAVLAAALVAIGFVLRFGG